MPKLWLPNFNASDKGQFEFGKEKEKSYLCAYASDGITKINDIKVGTTVEFGNYPQTADGGIKPIKWKIMKIENDRAYLISVNVLDLHTIGSNTVAFTECRSLTSIIIPDAVQTIGKECFKDCSGLYNVTLPSSLKIICHVARRLPFKACFICKLDGTGCCIA